MANPRFFIYCPITKSPNSVKTEEKVVTLENVIMPLENGILFPELTIAFSDPSGKMLSFTTQKNALMRPNSFFVLKFAPKVVFSGTYSNSL